MWSLAIWEGLRAEPLLLHIERNQLRWFRHLVRMPPGCLAGEVFQVCPIRRQARGRPRKRCRNCSCFSIVKSHYNQLMVCIHYSCLLTVMNIGLKVGRLWAWQRCGWCYQHSSMENLNIMILMNSFCLIEIHCLPKDNEILSKIGKQYPDMHFL